MGSGNFEPYLYLRTYLSNVVPIILLAYTTYEEGTDRVFRNFGTEVQMQGNHPKERIKQINICCMSSYG